MATFIEDGRLIVEDDGTRTDLTDQARTVIEALARLPATIPSARMGSPMVEAAQDIGNMFGWFNEPVGDPTGKPVPTSIFMVVQTDDDQDEAWWLLNTEQSREDGVESAEEIAEVVERHGYHPERLEDSKR